MQVRDEILKVKDDIPKSDVNREYYLQQVDAQLAQTDGTVAAGALGKIPSHKHEQLQRLARTTPYYKRNRPHICSFWVKGECKRGEECPYRHERPSDPDDPLSDQVRNSNLSYYQNKSDLGKCNIVNFDLIFRSAEHQGPLLRRQRPCC